MEFKCVTLPNIGIVETQLSQEIVKNLWAVIEEAKQNQVDQKKVLAGHISSSLRIDQKSKYIKNFINNVLPHITNKYIEVYKGLPVRHLVSNEHAKIELNLDSLWVNFQNKHEFNPIHCHGGALSFVIWMKIPTSSTEQNNLPISKNSSSQGLASNFSFIYNDILGTLRTFVYQLEKNISGYMVMFPSSLYHQVCPYYESDDTRITISGNIALHYLT